MSLDDLDFVAEMLADPLVMRFYPKCYARHEAESWIRRQLARYGRDGHALWLVEDRLSRIPIGQVGLLTQRVEGADEAEIGYLIHRPFWRQGFASEAAAASRDYAFGTLRKSRLISLIRPLNLPSQAVARKIGMCPERTAVHGGLEHIVFVMRRAEARAESNRLPIERFNHRTI
jgi:ribosomal-protein-alanine N-acetyltransferase